jgi:predicted ATPase/class 3 adenylate cyclase
LRREGQARQDGAVRQLPSGTVTFVFSDIEGSTRRWQENESAMRGALERHDAIVRSAIAGHAGHVVKHTGDGMLAVFAGAADAVAASVDAQRALRDADWGPLRLVVRMAVHSGETHDSDGDYFGPTLNRAARLMAVAHGGQILVSSSAAALARDRLDPGVTFVDVGEHRLRDLDRPERVFQACADGLERQFPPLRSPTSPLRGFPAVRTRIIGRDRLLAAIADRLGNEALVTLTGVGGSGKTRLAIEVGRRVGELLPDGGVFVDLSPLGDPGLIAQTIAGAVGVPHASAEDAGRDTTMDAVLAYLMQRRMLVVLDNCEHLLEGGAEIVDRLLAACPDVKLLVTSREGLGVQGESILAVPSLDLPSDERAAAESAAVQLFVERAAAAGAGPDVLARHEPAVVEVCRRLDGIPLALELAAAQLAHLTAEEVAERLDDRFRLLAGPSRRLHRQATLQAAVDWSYELLGEMERGLLARLSIFAGGFALDAAEAVCAGDGVEARRMVSLLASLVAKSLVVADTRDRATRYRLLETIRIYAGERLVERGEAEAVRVRHRDWYLAWIERMDDEPHGYPGLRYLSHLRLVDREIDNVRAALAWSAQEGRSDVVARLTVAADVLWGSGCYQEEGLRWLETARRGRLHDPALEVRCATLDGWLTMQGGHFLRVPEKVRQALEAAERAEQKPSGRPEAIGVLLLAGISHTFGDRAAGRQLIRRACEIADAHGLRKVEVAARGYEGNLWLVEGCYDDAVATLSAVAGAVDLDEPRFFEVYFGTELAIAYHLAGRHDEALRAASTFDPVAARLGEPLIMMISPATFALVRAGVGAPDAVLPELLDLLARARRDRLPVIAHYVLTIIAAVLSLRGDDEVASTVLAAAGTQLELPFRTPGHYAIFQHYGRLLRRRLGDDVSRRCRDEGRRLSFDAAAELVRETAARASKAAPK